MELLPALARVDQAPDSPRAAVGGIEVKWPDPVQLDL